MTTPIDLVTYSVEEAAVVCKCHEDSVYKAIKAGNLRAKKVGRAWVITQSNLNDFLNEDDNAPCSTDAANTGTPDSLQKESGLIDPQEELKKRRRRKLRVVGGNRS